MWDTLRKWNTGLNSSLARPLGQPLAPTGKSVLPIHHAPPILRRHGYAAAHSWPLVSHGKDLAGEFVGSFRVAADRAWVFPSLELRTPISYPLLIFDIDDKNSSRTISDLYMFDELPAPNWVVTRTGNGHSHAVYCLSTPVIRGANARIAPLKVLARISEYYAAKLDADARCTGVLSHNPMARAHGPEFETWWGHVGGYSLADLGECIPTGWRRPKMSQTAVGRNVDVFTSLCKWAGSPVNADVPVLPMAKLYCKTAHANPLPDSEVRSASPSQSSGTGQGGRTTPRKSAKSGAGVVG